MAPYSNFVLGFGFNLAISLLIVRFIYYPVRRDKDYVFTFLAFNTVVYLVLGLVSRVDLSVGVGFGLFAIFSVLRYRTDPIPIREMTYLFIIIAMPVMNSVLLTSASWTELVVSNALVAAILFGLEKEWGFHYETAHRITYEKIELIRPENRVLLLEDLRQRTGLPISRCEIGRVNFLRDTAELQVFYDRSHESSAKYAPAMNIYSSNGRTHTSQIVGRRQ
jgi:hypothetical protein